MQLTRGHLNRTLLLRQHLLERVAATVPDEVEHLIGLQAQDNLPPYLGLAARLARFDPREVSSRLRERRLIRFLTMRGTIHLLTPADAALRRFTQPCQDREARTAAQPRAALQAVDPAGFLAAVDAALAEGPLSMNALRDRLAAGFPDVPANALAQLARLKAPLVQVPPRGCWKASGQVIYQRADTWTGEPLTEPDVPTLVRRYLAAFGPATPADFTAWSGVQGAAALFAQTEGLVEHADEAGRVLYDVPGAPIAEPDVPAPVRLLGKYDNVFLSHAGRDRVTDPAARQNWAQFGAATAHLVFADGWLVGFWRPTSSGEVEVIELLRELTPRESAELEAEKAVVRELMMTPPD